MAHKPLLKFAHWLEWLTGLWEGNLVGCQFLTKSSDHAMEMWRPGVGKEHSVPSTLSSLNPILPACYFAFL